MAKVTIHVEMWAARRRQWWYTARPEDTVEIYASPRGSTGTPFGRRSVIGKALWPALPHYRAKKNRSAISRRVPIDITFTVEEVSCDTP